MSTLQKVVDVTVAPVVGAMFGAASFVRRARTFHPHGAAFQASIDIEPGGVAAGASGLGSVGRHAAVVRVSRGAGLPTPVPDILGIAVRIVDAHGAGQPQDLLLASSGAAPVLRGSLVPARHFGDAFYSSLLPYDHGGRRILFGARPVWSDDRRPTDTLERVEDELVAGRLRIEVVAAAPSAPWQRVATIDIGRRLGDAEQESLRFDVFNSGDALQPAGALNALRAKAYRWSQAGRPTPIADATQGSRRGLAV